MDANPSPYQGEVTFGSHDESEGRDTWLALLSTMWEGTGPLVNTERWIGYTGGGPDQGEDQKGVALSRPATAYRLLENAYSSNRVLYGRIDPAISWSTTTEQSQKVALLHDRMDVFSSPGSAAYLGRILDRGHVSTRELYSWVDTPNGLRDLLRVARARLLRETATGYKPEAAATRLARQILRVAET
ncbi:MAG: hypothetical protein OXG61_11220 [Chloroflexi bacterium]|nr:hypothetical protein [Chloroflexota bacterium]